MASERVRLADIRERAERATPGPWGLRHVMGIETWPVVIADGIGAIPDVADGAFANPEDAAFVAHSRQDVPALLAALEAVLALHVPLNALGTPVCAHCNADEEGEAMFILWPCPTVRAIESVIDLGGEGRG